ncbi:serine/threonine-protein kinase [Polyangium sp. y55x31]|uniref:serine/threonine-protein kinase n=1 Tax=Polyangium sp. y55x31 TaxID=3042688 RepID=UPI00248274B8|nr:serine/threonine-protein kinase [Polyangium sp. y55x31]MDI1482604.1 protein kinase [Polyangium sp. y55x31]
MEIEAGTLIANRYRVIRPLGRGGMGEVFAAENTRTGRPVAIKVLHADAKAKHSAVERFRREARAAGSINSDYVTQVLDVEEDANFGIVLVFELLEGESLIDRLKRTGPIHFDELYVIIEQVWMGLADAHRVKIIHRDLKPSNVFLERRPDGSTRVKILDFGISKLPKEMEGETLTEMGQSLGTFSFMPPEQIGKAKMVDERADIYACTTMIYQSLTGQLPYLAKNVLVMVEMKAKAPPRRIGDAMDGPIDPRLESFVARGLARDPDQRFQTATEALAAWRELSPRSSGAPYVQPNALGTAHTQPAPQTAVSMSRTPSHTPPSMGGGPRGTFPYDVTRQEPHIRRPEPPPIEAENTTDDAAATLAMPIARLMPNQNGGGPQWPPLPQPSGSSAARPSPSGYGSTSNSYPGLSSSGTYGVVQPPVPASQNMPPGYGSPMQTPMPNATYPEASRSYGQQSMSVPAQQPAWQQQTGMQPIATSTPQPEPRRMWPFLLGGVLFALIGFGIVAAIMLSTGK